MPLRRTFLLGAAALASTAALVAIATVLTGRFGETEGDIFATLGATFVAGSTALAAIACLECGSPVVGTAGAILAPAAFLLWTEEIWARHHSSAYWKVLWLALIWTLATLLIATTRLMTPSPKLRRTLFPATAAAAVLTAAVASTMTLRAKGDGWQLFAVLLILAVLGEILTPILQRFAVTPADDGRPSERVLATVGGAVVVAVRNGRSGRRVRIGGADVPLRDDETIVVRHV